MGDGLARALHEREKDKAAAPKGTGRRISAPAALACISALEGTFPMQAHSPALVLINLAQDGRHRS